MSDIPENKGPFHQVEELDEWYINTMDGIARTVATLRSDIPKVQDIMVASSGITRAYESMYQLIEGSEVPEEKIWSREDILIKYR